ncbi:arginyltransferase [Halochromatium glycolicum]|uniref:Aspartate/glutamate leucyltransferase n=1 Tax=Halochromatium glycolicum TaxID=85075 RepID=A0AAJ0U4J9_9GAMM|nr:arginyltransferase [Halochromatium glycolicum]MBK1705144.1 arginyltransferase [Halochromatium glycolicum]
MNANRNLPGHLQLYLTGEHDCSYLDGLRARTLFVDPMARIDRERAQWLQQIGFRRSGMHFYRPACRGCQRCIPVRVPVADLRLSRSQRRNASRNDGEVRIAFKPAQLQPAHYQLYERYILARHGDGDMAEDVSIETYMRFLLSPWGGQTWFIEAYLGERLMSVAVTDIFSDGLSALYTFFDPELSERGPGTYAVLTQAREAARLGLRHLYLGYWIEESPKMAYKDRFRPIEAWDGRDWLRFERGEPIRFCK